MFKKSILVSLVALLLISVPVGNVSAHHRHFHRHHRSSRVARHHHHRRRGRRHHRRHRRYRSSRPSLKSFKKQVRNQTYHDIYLDRRAHGARRVTYNRRLNWVANTRSNQLPKRYSHYYGGKVEDPYLMRRYHVHYAHYGENISELPLSSVIRSGKYMANILNNNSLHHDQSFRNYHRRNILNKRFNRVGIGVACRHGDLYTAIDYADVK